MDFQATSKRCFELLWESVISRTASTSNALSPVHLDAKLQILDSLLVVFREVVKTEIAKIQRQRNGSTPFHKLPTEIVVAIFDLLVHEAEDRPKCIGTLSTVSSAWNAIVSDTPGLWSHIHTDYSPAFVEKVLYKSANCSITVQGQLSSSDVGYQQAILSTCDQLARWSSATLESHSHAELDPLTYSGAPMLRSLEVTCVGQVGDAQRPINLCDGHAPLLQDLSIVGFNAVLTSPIFSGLLTLTLQAMRGIELRQVADILRACPDLRILKIIDVGFSGQLQLGPSRTQLPNLIQMDMRNPSFDHSQHLLTSIHCPSVRVIAVAIPAFITDLLPQQAAASIQPLVSFAVRFLNGTPVREAAKLPKFLFSQGHCAISSYHQGSLRTLWFNGGGIPRRVEILLEGIHQAWPLPTLALVAPPGPSNGWKIASKFRTTICLQLKEEAESVKYLGTPGEQVGGTMHWPFPTLKSLRLDGSVCEAPEDVVEMMQGRKGCLLSPDVPRELPESLTDLFIGASCPMDGATFTKLKSILPEATVTWEGEGGSG